MMKMMMMMITKLFNGDSRRVDPIRLNDTLGLRNCASTFDVVRDALGATTEVERQSLSTAIEKQQLDVALRVAYVCSDQ